MIIIKFVSLTIILALSSYLGIMISNKYRSRVIELKEIKKALNIFETKIKYTYEPIPEIFKEMSNNLSPNIGPIFENASEKMKNTTAKQAWIEAVETSKNNMNKEDIEVIKGLGKLLGEIDVQGQVSQIELTDNFINFQIEKAQKEYEKNEKLYKTLRSSIRARVSHNTYITLETKEKIYGYQFTF